MGRRSALRKQIDFLPPESYSRAQDFVQSPFRYPGGKFYALRFIVPLLEAIPHAEYREPFVGGGSVFFGKTKAPFSWINDLEGDLIETYRALQDEDRCQLLCQRLAGEVASRARHTEIRDFVPQTPDDIAFRTYYLNRTSYSGIIHKPAWGYAVGSSSPPENWPRAALRSHWKLQNVKITALDFSDVLQASPASDSLVAYLDPPYFMADQRRAYTKPFAEEDHLRLSALLSQHSMPFVLSYDDCMPIRDLYSWANIYPREWLYNTANSKGPRKLGRELIITNVTFRQKRDGQLKLV